MSMCITFHTVDNSSEGTDCVEHWKEIVCICVVNRVKVNG